MLNKKDQQFMKDLIEGSIRPVRDDIRRFRKEVKFMIGYLDRDVVTEKKRTDKIVEHLELPKDFGYES